MTKILSKDIKLKYVAKSRPQSLILRIPAVIRDIMELHYDDTLRMEVIVEENEKWIKISKKMD